MQLAVAIGGIKRGIFFLNFNSIKSWFALAIVNNELHSK
jgi:hypothetical protein